MSKIEANLKNIIFAIDKIKNYTSEFEDADGFYNNQKSFDAVLMQFIVIGEAVSRLDEAFKEETSYIPWKEIKSFRNIIAHDYFGVDANEVWEIINTKLIPLKNDIQKLL